jgi:hypothetical protein
MVNGILLSIIRHTVILLHAVVLNVTPPHFLFSLLSAIHSQNAWQESGL